MLYKEYTYTTHQSNLIFKKNTVKKIYLLNNENKLSSVKNEIYCLNKFAIDNDYAPEIMKNDEISYTMKRYDFSLGNTKEIFEHNIRRLLFFCSLDEIFRQLDEIENILKQRNILHRDVNPGNILFSKKKLKLKLIDFYWALTPDINYYHVPGLNSIYGEDSKAFSKIKEQIANVDKKIKNQVKYSKENMIINLGKKYYDGSAKHIGKTYHPIDISYYKDNLYHKNVNYEFQNVVKNIKRPIKSVIDIGCAAGYYSFNFIRMYEIEKIMGYEADPVMFSILEKIKNTFCLDEFIINRKVDNTTKFEDVDLVICMNVHMWLEKQLGKKADIVIANLIEHSKEMFFQTAGAESSGMYLVKNLRSKEDIKKYLERLGGKEVTFIGTSESYGIRYLFKISNI